MEYSLIGDQLAKIAATVDSVQQPYDPDTRCVLSKIFLYWRQCTREACKVGARDRAWCSMKTQKTLRKSMAKWGTWLQGNRGLGAERAAREAAADAQRLSRALQCFRKSCLRNQHRRQLQVALRTLRNITQWRPIERAWDHWQKIVRLTETNAVFGAWAAVTQHQRQLETAMRSVCASNEVMLVAPIWKRWKKRAGASTLAKLLHAWAVIGPVRRAIGIIRKLATEARAVERLQHRLLRKGLRHGFAASVVERRLSKSVVSRARGHDRTRALRKSFHRWLVRHRLAQSIAMWQHRVQKARQRASIKVWVSKTAFCERTFGENSVSRRINKRATTAFTGRHTRLWAGLKRWRARAVSSQRLRRSQDSALMMRRVWFLRQGLASFTWWTQAAEASRVAYDARSALQARSLFVAFSCWRRRASRFRCQHSLERSASVHFVRKSLAAGMSLWRKRVAYVTDARFTIRDFKLRWRLHLGVVRLRRWTENQRANGLRIWRARVWAEAFGATRALKMWRRRAQAQTDMKTSVRIAFCRNQTRRCCSPLDRRIFGVLKSYARARNLERRVLRAWFSHTERTIQASKQARLSLLRSGLQGLRQRVKVSEIHRDRQLRASSHRNYMLVRAKFNVWRNMLYPLGVPAQWGPKLRPYTYSDSRGAKKSTGTQHEHSKKLALRSRGLKCLETTEAARVQDWEGSSRCASLVLLRLPLIGQRVRRVLYVWRKRAKADIRFQFIRNTLPNKMARRPGSNKGPASFQERLSKADAAQVHYVRRRQFNQGNHGATEQGFKGLGRCVELSTKGRSEPKGYLHIHVLNTSDTKVPGIR